jgi:hypothetical protein
MKRQQFGYVVALGLTCGRLVLAFLVILLAVNGRAGLLYLICLLIAFISDYYDGVIARHFQVATAKLRRFDSLTDVAFYGASLLDTRRAHYLARLSDSARCDARYLTWYGFTARVLRCPRLALASKRDKDWHLVPTRRDKPPRWFRQGLL